MANPARIIRKRTCTRVKIKSELLNSWLESIMNSEFSNAEISRCEKYLTAATSQRPHFSEEAEQNSSGKIESQKAPDIVQMISLFSGVSLDAEISAYEVLTSLSKFALLHNLTEKCNDDVVRLVSSLMPKTGVCFPDLLDSVTELIPNIPSPRVLGHCPECLSVVQPEEQQCLDCDTVIVGDKVVSVQNDLAAVLKHLFEHSQLAEVLMQQDEVRANKNKENLLTDLTDGLRYKSLPREAPFDLSLVLNAHTFPFHTEAGGSIKRFTVLSTFFTIAELDPVLRKKFVLLHSTWIFPVSSDSNFKAEAFTSLSETLDDLSTRGIRWTHPSSKVHTTSKAFLLFASVDRRLRNVMQCLSADSCSYCEHPGVEGSKGQRVYPFAGQHELMRTHANVLKHAMRRNGEKVVAGCSPLFFLSDFNVVDGFSVEYQNNVLMAVVKNILTLCLSEGCQGKDYHLKSDGVAADRLKQISGQMPDYVDSRQSGLDNVQNWTSTECRNWLLFYSIPCLEREWPDELFQHHLLLVQAIYSLLRDRISQCDLAKTQIKLEDYCQAFAGHFGAEAMTLDVHNLLHLVRNVRQCGPLWSSSTSAFRQSQEFVSEAFSRLKTYPEPEMLKNLAEHINQHATLQLVCGVQDKNKNTSRILSGVVTDLKPVIVDFLNNVVKLDMKQATFYSRVKINGCLLDTDEVTSYFQFQRTDASARRWAKLLCLFSLVGKDGNTQQFFLASTVSKSQHNPLSVSHMSRFVVPETLPVLVWQKVEVIKAPLFLVGDFLCAPPYLQFV